VRCIGGGTLTLNAALFGMLRNMAQQFNECIAIGFRPLRAATVEPTGICRNQTTDQSG